MCQRHVHEPVLLRREHSEDSSGLFERPFVVSFRDETATEHVFNCFYFFTINGLRSGNAGQLAGEDVRTVIPELRVDTNRLWEDIVKDRQVLFPDLVEGLVDNPRDIVIDERCRRFRVGVREEIEILTDLCS